jgi:putative peptidoglycan lipid II flippase
MTSKHQIVRRSAVVGFFSLLGSVTGILVETTIAAKLSLSRSSDTFYVALTVPYLITNLLAGTSQFSLVPFFSALDAQHSEDEMWHGFSYVANVVVLGSTAVAGIGMLAAPWVIHGIAPGFTPAQIQLGSELGRWLFLIVVPAALAEVFRSFLLSQHRFATASAANFFRNAAVIVAVAFTFGRYGIWSIVLGYFAGYLLQLVVVAAQTLFSFHVRYSFAMVGRGGVFRNLHGAGASQIIAAGAWQVVFVVERMIASFLPPGTLTALNYGFKIMGTLAELLAGSVGTATLPVISRAVARQAQSEERRTFQHTIKLSLIFVLPVTVCCLVLPRTIIRLVFEHGNFSAAATSLMAHVFFYYSLGVALFAFMRVLNFYLFARHQAGAFLRYSLLLYGTTIVFDVLYVLVLHLGAKGIPLGLITAHLVTIAVALIKNVAGLRSIFDRSLEQFAMKNAVGGAAAGLTMAGLRAWVAPPQATLHVLAYLCVVCGAGTFVFLASLAALGILPISEVIGFWRRAQDV